MHHRRGVHPCTFGYHGTIEITYCLDLGQTMGRNVTFAIM